MTSKIKMADVNVKYFKVKVSAPIGVQEKESIMSVNLSLGSQFSITQRSLVVPNCDP